STSTCPRSPARSVEAFAEGSSAPYDSRDRHGRARTWVIKAAPMADHRTPTSPSTPALAKRLQSIAPSATIAIADRAAALRASGVDVLSFGLGEPDFDTPEFIRDAAKAALDKGATRYTKVRGIAPLREAIAADSLARRGIAHDPEEIVVSTG